MRSAVPVVWVVKILTEENIPASGMFMRIMIRDEITHWSTQVFNKVNGILTSDDRFPCNVGIGSKYLIEYLQIWSSVVVGEKHIIMTAAAAEILLPKMAAPVVEFTLATPTIVL